jgi:vibriolysin
VQTAALHEAFSDMSTVAIKYYLYHKVDWELARDISKDDQPIRYINSPKRDGYSIDHVVEYPTNIPEDQIDPHLVAGIFNKAFYLLATTPGWDVHKAFDVMVQANLYHWTASTKTFEQIGCGIMGATKDLAYNAKDVKAALTKVGIETKNC